MVTKVINELKSVSRLKILPEPGPRFVFCHIIQNNYWTGLVVVHSLYSSRFGFIVRGSVGCFIKQANFLAD